MTDSNLLLFGREGTLPERLGAGDCAHVAVRPLQHDRRPERRRRAGRAFTDLLLGMSYADARSDPCSISRASPSGCPVVLEATPRWNRPSTISTSTTMGVRSLPPTIDLDGLGLDEGGHLLLDHALPRCPRRLG